MLLLDRRKLEPKAAPKHRETTPHRWSARVTHLHRRAQCVSGDAERTARAWLGLGMGRGAHLVAKTRAAQPRERQSHPPSTTRQPHTDGLPASPTCTDAYNASVVTLSAPRALGWAWGWAGGRTWSRKPEQPNQESAKATPQAPRDNPTQKRLYGVCTASVRAA